MSQESKRVRWVLCHVNTELFLGRFNEYWTRGAMSTAVLFETPDEASSARQALLAEGVDRIAKPNAPSFWFDMVGGLVEVQEVEVVTRVVEQP